MLPCWTDAKPWRIERTTVFVQHRRVTPDITSRSLSLVSIWPRTYQLAPLLLRANSPLSGAPQVQFKKVISVWLCGKGMGSLSAKALYPHHCATLNGQQRGQMRKPEGSWGVLIRRHLLTRQSMRILRTVAISRDVETAHGWKSLFRVYCNAETGEFILRRTSRAVWFCSNSGTARTDHTLLAWPDTLVFISKPRWWSTNGGKLFRSKSLMCLRLLSNVWTGAKCSRDYPMCKHQLQFSTHFHWVNKSKWQEVQLAQSHRETNSLHRRSERLWVRNPPVQLISL